jgi:hypothetical protein
MEKRNQYHKGTMGNGIWHLTDDFTKLPAKDVFSNILRDDRSSRIASIDLGVPQPYTKHWEHGLIPAG